MKKDDKKQQYRVNEQIRVREVRIVGDGVESAVMPTSRALQMSEQRGVDLVEITHNSITPVCRLIDYSK
ncbi:MAG: translation initiation factor IF-3, partial [Bacteroidaceae bacterium]|nr:translation initiation factor IF-3 [Bacteroidaceae bacterium]